MAGSRYPRVDVMIKSLPGVHYALIHASRSRHIQDPTAAFPSCLGIPLRTREVSLLADVESTVLAVDEILNSVAHSQGPRSPAGRVH